MVHIDQVLKNSETKLDVDLSDSSTFKGTADFQPVTDVDRNNTDPEPAQLYSDSKQLIERPGSDVTVRQGRRNLDRMRDKKFLDVKDYQEKRIVHPDMDNYEILNTFREIRTKIIQDTEGKNQVIMVVSFQHGMGSTFSAINLAAAFSYEGEMTSLIIDCDQHKKKLDKIFSADVTFGLTDYLDDNDIDTEKIIYQTGINRMRYIPVGNRRETVGEFFSSEKMKSFILQLKKRYSDRYIILNAPPLEISADAAILSSVTDRIVVILPYGHVSNQRIQKALRLIPKDKIIGFVINNKTKYV